MDSKQENTMTITRIINNIVMTNNNNNNHNNHNNHNNNIVMSLAILFIDMSNIS